MGKPTSAEELERLIGRHKNVRKSVKKKRKKTKQNKRKARVPTRHKNYRKAEEEDGRVPPVILRALHKKGKVHQSLKWVYCYSWYRWMCRSNPCLCLSRFPQKEHTKDASLWTEAWFIRLCFDERRLPQSLQQKVNSQLCRRKVSSFWVAKSHFKQANGFSFSWSFLICALTVSRFVFVRPHMGHLYLTGQESLIGTFPADESLFSCTTTHCSLSEPAFPIERRSVKKLLSGCPKSKSDAGVPWSPMSGAGGNLSKW